MTYKLADNESVFASASRVFKAPPLSEFSKWASNYSPTQDSLNKKNSNFFSDPRHPYTRGLISSLPQNIISCEMAIGKGKITYWKYQLVILCCAIADKQRKNR